MDLLELTLIEARKGLADRRFSCTEYVDALIAETEAQAHLNCYLHRDSELLRAQARAFDKGAVHGALAGIPIAIKDNIDVAGIATTGGTAALRQHVAQHHAPVAAHLLAAGALYAGKANLHELAFGITSNNGVFGPCRNPYDRDLIAGGSSGGSAALLAARLAPAAVGTDTGGSVRIPAALCGVVGLRPSSGRYSQQGIVPISHTRDTAGPMARSVADVALLDQIMAGSPELQPLTAISPGQLRLGVLRNPSWVGLEQEVEAAAEGALARLAKAGVELVDVELPTLQALNGAAGFAIVLYEFLVDLPAYLHASDAKQALLDILKQVGSPDVAGIIHAAMDQPVPEQAYRQALRERAMIQALYDDCFRSNRLDALIFPTTALTARPIGEDANVDLNGERIPTFGAFARNVDGASIAGLPGISIPLGLSEHGLPVGLELDGPAGWDRRLLEVAACVEAILGTVPPPPRQPR
ncbi:indoleacetamide hydrolase [Herbaspirillum huttiense]|uniref:Indoleacetamide hydrolase n=2 Tax=Herbaspirillum huttiense TaxID=863372 RepID=A0AAJ2HED2_9BURK|nr:indoleacetamide hydrolase [Herbaspirillum huttiense]MDR9838841.1 indoleacetamide hydrolase [Herbaspirillum huttiense]